MPNDDVSALSYEAARDQLADVVRTLESGTASLEDSLTLWERGEALAAHCQAWLDGARKRLDRAARGEAGASGTPATPRDIGEEQLSGASPTDYDALEESDDAADLEDAAQTEDGER